VNEWEVFDVGATVRVADLRCALHTVSAHSYWYKKDWRYSMAAGIRNWRW